MNQHLQSILDQIQQSETLNASEKNTISVAIKEVDKILSITEFKLERTEKVKRTTAILLEETIEELEQKRKAVEAQNRELEIESSLERVRTMAMGMRKPDDLLSICEIIFSELQHMGFGELRNTMINIHDDDAGSFLNYDYSSDAGKTITTHFYNNIHPVIEKQLKHVRSSNDAFSETIFTGKDLEDWRAYRKRKGEPDDPKVDTIPALFYYFYSIGFGSIGISTYSSVTEDKKNVLKRFRNVFDLAYRRYIDITKAEAQAREARIELALERVRSRAMAMQNSDELAELVSTVFKELTLLDFALTSCIIWINNPELSTDELWVASTELNRPAQPYYLKPFHHPFFKSIVRAWKEKDQKWVYELSGNEKKTFQEMFFKDVRILPDALKAALQVPHSVVFSASFSSFGALEVVGTEALSGEKFDILHRFGRVFDLTYTRFNDLKKAEAQAREARIETALERVRSKAMAMHSSEDLAQTVDTFFTELNSLNVTPRRCGVGIIDMESRIVELHATTATQKNETKNIAGKLTLAGHPVLDNIFESWIQQKEYHPVLHGAEILEYYKVMNPQVTFPDFAGDETQFGYYFFFKEGGVFAWTDKELADGDLQIFRRYTSVLSLTYRRYMDLKEAETQAKEAIKQASLDRVRGQVASMRTTKDLQRITPLVWNELTTMGVPFIRCGVFIIDEIQTNVQVYLSAPDGRSLAVLNLPIQANDLTVQSVDHWRKGMVYQQHWNKEDFIIWTQSMLEQGQIQDKDTYQGAASPPESLDLHFIPFTQGMLYVGNTNVLSDNEIDLVKSLAEAFSIAYARYEDFTKLEKAKQSIESALTELKATQSQLIQSEKMASLGELTAGIAHEIQNPLNFVNNFSDVSNELLDEMKIELTAGNNEDAMAIADDVKQNLEKILHHGKRADAIVKGMLQHSRSSSGVKEPTNINALADEYLRLAYHGLRAKDKSFNATMLTDFDESIGKINIIPQDIGRVILNLITNAFYAVTEKKNSSFAPLLPVLRSSIAQPDATAQQPGGYEFEPTVTITTKKQMSPLGDLGARGAEVEIRVKDNGNGIPKNVLDKIFQPFFTTKPPGQGTGLGLSLSYDIIKAHGGELNVETKEGEGSSFIINLPANTY